MRVTEHFALGRTQPFVDFIDVDIATDIPLFVDPRALRFYKTEWGEECIQLLQHFFATVLDAIHQGDHARGVKLLGVLREPNETRLGFSVGKPRGHALGPKSSLALWDALSKSEAARSGLLEDLEDTILMIEGVGADLVSDIATNVIRDPLIRYTQAVARAYGIPLTPDVDSGVLWDPASRSWGNRYEELPVVDAKNLILVPKAIVRRHVEFEVTDYYRNFVLPHLQEVELASPNSALVAVLKNGDRRVYKKDLEAKYGQGKRAAVDLTLKNPDLLDKYRTARAETPRRPALGHEAIAALAGGEVPDWEALLDNVRSVAPGNAGATNYHRSVEDFLSALFYPALAEPHIERELHDGRKRIDIDYTNIAADGFFRWLSLHYAAPHVFVECKNYSSDPANEALDQLAGRFSPQRGRFGLLVCRNFVDKNLFQQRCRDTAKDGRGYIIGLDDNDLAALTEAGSRQGLTFPLLKQQFDYLIF